MSNRDGPKRGGALNVVLLGRRCAMTTRVLEMVLASELRVTTIVLASSLPGMEKDPALPVVSQPIEPSPVDRLAAASGIESTSINRGDLERLAPVLSARQPDALIAACFPWKIPAAVRSAPRLGALNVHPSLLPRHRGPEPLFWTFRGGDRVTGVTVHVIDEAVDQGAILMQQRVALAPGIQYQRLEDDLATLGGTLAARAVQGLHSGSLIPTPQSGSPGDWARMPARDDLIVTPEWSAERAFRFVAGVGDLFGPVTVEKADGTRVDVVDALQWHPAGTGRDTATRSPETVSIKLDGGSVVFRKRSRPAVAGR